MADKKKSLLNESTIRRFMALAGVESLVNPFLKSVNEQPVAPAKTEPVPFSGTTTTATAATTPAVATTTPSPPTEEVVEEAEELEEAEDTSDFDPRDIEEGVEELEEEEELEEKKKKSTARSRARSKAIAKALLSPPGPKSIKSISKKRKKEIFGTDKPPKPRKAGEFKGYEDQPTMAKHTPDRLLKLKGLSRKEREAGMLKTAKVKVAKKRSPMKITPLKQLTAKKKGSKNESKNPPTSRTLAESILRHIPNLEIIDDESTFKTERQSDILQEVLRRVKRKLS